MHYGTIPIGIVMTGATDGGVCLERQGSSGSLLHRSARPRGAGGGGRHREGVRETTEAACRALVVEDSCLDESRI